LINNSQVQLYLRESNIDGTPTGKLYQIKLDETGRLYIDTGEGGVASIAYGGGIDKTFDLVASLSGDNPTIEDYIPIEGTGIGISYSNPSNPTIPGNPGNPNPTAKPTKEPQPTEDPDM